MPRHSRIKSKTNIYHVMNRGLNKQLLFDDEVDYLRYLQLKKNRDGLKYILHKKDIKAA